MRFYVYAGIHIYGVTLLSSVLYLVGFKRSQLKLAQYQAIIITKTLNIAQSDFGRSEMTNKISLLVKEQK